MAQEETYALMPQLLHKSNDLIKGTLAHKLIPHRSAMCKKEGSARAGTFLQAR